MTSAATVLAPRPTVSRPDFHDVPATRYRAIDAYRALAMVGVAVGHWLAADVRVGTNGGLTGGNALDQLRTLHLLTWVFQVMPLFFCIGGFSNAASLTAHWRKGRTSSSWVQARLLRLVGPSAILAATWFTILSLTGVTGIGSNVGLAAAGVAAIPLWFLANYVVDTAVAPITLRLFREHRRPFLGILALTFLSLESMRFFHVRFLPQGNIVIGWMCFQVLGFAWRDGLLPSTQRLVQLGAAGFALAVSLVALGPWPVAMVSVPGAQFANTWPPSLALLAFGFGYCAIAIAAAPRLGLILERSKRTWAVVVGANAVTMTSYLWHFSAMIVAAGIAMPLHLLPTSTVGSGDWWLHKLGLMTLATVVLVAILSTLGRKERAALLDGREQPRRVPANHVAVTATLAIALGTGFELWTSAGGNRGLMLSGTGLVLAVRIALSKRPTTPV